ncbi:MAG: hypothetical protein WD097_08190 [Balneolales bacterium]
MNTAKKLVRQFPEPFSTRKERNNLSESKLPILQEAHELFALMGWDNLPQEIRLSIAVDVIGYRDELSGLYSTCDPMVRNRRKSISFWVNNYLNGYCNADTAAKALRVCYLD